MPSRKGSPNKNKQFLLNRLQDMYGEDFDPIINASENAMRMQKLADRCEEIPDDASIEDKLLLMSSEFDRRKECVNAWDRIAQYVTPKLKSVEITGDPENPVSISSPVLFVDADQD